MIFNKSYEKCVPLALILMLVAPSTPLLALEFNELIGLCLISDIQPYKNLAPIVLVPLESSASFLVFGFIQDDLSTLVPFGQNAGNDVEKQKEKGNTA